MTGIATDVQLRDVKVMDNKNTGVHFMRLAGFTEAAEVSWTGGLMAGQASPDLCTACPNLAAPGCPSKLSHSSYNNLPGSPFNASSGLLTSTFALAFAPGPEMKSWDNGPEPVVHGRTIISGVTIADFPGAAGCGGSAAYAITNRNMPNSFTPHYFSRMNVVNVATTG